MGKMKELFLEQRQREMESSSDLLYSLEKDAEFFWDKLSVDELRSLLPSPYAYFINKRIKELEDANRDNK